MPNLALRKSANKINSLQLWTYFLQNITQTMTQVSVAKLKLVTSEVVTDSDPLPPIVQSQSIITKSVRSNVQVAKDSVTEYLPYSFITRYH